MKLYKHYKNKPYKYVGVAKHSETLEDLVVYETLYENSIAKLWVRPKKMFFETLQIDGKEIARFQAVEINFFEYTNISETLIETIVAPLMKSVFGEWDPKKFYSTYKSQQKFHLIVASIENENIGFKLGYETSQNDFYSWLGGVVKGYQNLGIASAMMKKQHQWCEQTGYKKIQTKTLNRFPNMLILNIQNGFEIIGTYSSGDKGMKIVLEKKLA